MGYYVFASMAFAVRVQVKRLIPQLTSGNAPLILDEFTIETDDDHKSRESYEFAERKIHPLLKQLEKQQQQPQQLQLQLIDQDKILSKLKKRLSKSEYLEDYILYSGDHLDNEHNAELSTIFIRYASKRASRSLAELEEKKEKASQLAKKLGLTDYEIVFMSDASCG